MYFTGNESALMVQPRNLGIVGENPMSKSLSVTQLKELKSSVNKILLQRFCSKNVIVDYYKIQTTI
jgi:Fe-S cluster assembly protein SufD